LIQMVKLLILQEKWLTTQINLDKNGSKQELHQEKLLLLNITGKCNLIEKPVPPKLNIRLKLSIRSSKMKKLEMLAWKNSLSTQLPLMKHHLLQDLVNKENQINLLLKKMLQKMMIKSNSEITNKDLNWWPTELQKFSHLEDTQRQSLPHGKEELLIWLIQMVKFSRLIEICQKILINLELPGLKLEQNQEKLLLLNITGKCNLIEKLALPKLNIRLKLSIKSSKTKKLEMQVWKNSLSTQLSLMKHHLLKDSVNKQHQINLLKKKNQRPKMILLSMKVQDKLTSLSKEIAKLQEPSLLNNKDKKLNG